tara:strand:+ start:2097 stop:3680 length:1584 start_codon:yes stop_codon:yes gene_type:complete
MKNLFITAFLAMLLLAISCAENINKQKVVSNNTLINVTSTNPKAIEFYRKAKLHLIDAEYIEAKESYLSALRLDPKMFMSLLEINELNGVLARNYKRKAAENLEKANEFEKIFYEYDKLSFNSSDRKKKQELSKKIIEIYPDKVDGYLMLGLSFNSYNDESAAEALKSFEKALEIDPENIEVRYNILRYTYGGSNRAYRLKTDIEFFNSFDVMAKSLISKFPRSLRIKSSTAAIYRNAYNFSDEKRIEISKKLYDDCLEIVNSTGSSFKINLLNNVAKLNLQMGNIDEAYSLFQSNIDLSSTNSQKINSYFRFFLAKLYDGDYLNAIRKINEFENNLNDLDLTEEQLLKCMVGLSNYKAIIFAHANQKEKALEALNSYKLYSNQLTKFYGFKDNIDSQFRSLAGSGFLRWKEASPRRQLWHEIWINMMVGNYKIAESLQNKFENKFGDRQIHWDGILNVLQGNTEKGYSILRPMGFGYMQYFKSQALISLGEREKAKSVLDSVRQLPEGNIFNNLIVKRSSDLYETL